MVGENSLFHGKSVFIEASVDFEDIAFELLSKGVSLNFLSHTFLEEDPASVIIIDVEGFGGSIGRVGDTELH